MIKDISIRKNKTTVWIGRQGHESWKYSVHFSLKLIFNSYIFLSVLPRKQTIKWVFYLQTMQTKKDESN